MIKLLVLLFIFVSLYAQETLYNLPDNHSRFQYELGRSFKSASQILIITPSLHHSKISKNLISSIKKGRTVRLIVQDAHGDPLSLIQYKNIELYLSSLKLNQTIIMLDDSLICTGNAALNEELYNSQHSIIRCSDEPNKINSLQNTFYPLIRDAKPYLE